MPLTKFIRKINQTKALQIGSFFCIPYKALMTTHAINQANKSTNAAPLLG